MSYDERRTSAATEKSLIGRAVAELIDDRTSGIIDDGSTCEAVARALSGRDLTALTLSVHGAVALGDRPGSHIVTPGGELDADELSWCGARAVADVSGFYADWAVLGACALDGAHGLTSSRMHDAEMKRAAIRSAQRIIVAALDEKLDLTATFAVAPIEKVDVLVTTSLPTQLRTELTAVGVEVIEVA